MPIGDDDENNKGDYVRNWENPAKIGTQLHSNEVLDKTMLLESMDAVHVWQINLDVVDCARLEVMLSDDERIRAARFAFDQLRCDYIRARCALRLVLARYSNRLPSELVFQYGTSGKPLMKDQAWHFNLSHSGRTALIAIAAHPIGVDVEYISGGETDFHSLIQLVFHPIEKRAFFECKIQEQRLLFYQTWCHKEAYFKALGTGLDAMPSVHIRNESPDNALLVCNPSCEKDGHYYCYSIALHFSTESYAASVCLPIANAKITLKPFNLVDFLR